MDFLRKQIHELTSEDVSTFCEQGISEGIQLDYKRELSNKGLSKHFAAFSNARGGLIIVGVEESSSNGKPIKWEGLEPDGKLEDRIHQYASNVDPLPLYEVHSTNPDANGKVFLLIRIFEGDRAPYYVINDANIHMRTGNITKQCLELASPQETARLFEKRENTKLAQQVSIEKAERVYKHTIERFDKRGRSWHKANVKASVYLAPIPTIGVFTTIIQPQFPNKALASTPELLNIINKVKQSKHRLYWSKWDSPETIQEGILISECQTSNNPRFTACQEILASGLIFGRQSISYTAPYSQDHTVSVGNIIEQVYEFLTAAREIYLSLHYQGGLIGHIEMSGLDNLRMEYFGPISRRFDARDILLPSDRWDFETDTSKLFNTDDLKVFFTQLISEIIWSFGWSTFKMDYLRNYIDEKKWFVS